MNYDDFEIIVREVIKQAKENDFFEVVELISDVLKKGYDDGFSDGFDYAFEILARERKKKLGK